MGTSSSEVVSSERGISSTSSSEEEDEKEGDAERGREVRDGEGLNGEFSTPDCGREMPGKGCLGGAVTGGGLLCFSDFDWLDRERRWWRRREKPLLAAVFLSVGISPFLRKGLTGCPCSH